MRANRKKTRDECMRKCFGKMKCMPTDHFAFQNTASISLFKTPSILAKMRLHS